MDTRVVVNSICEALILCLVLLAEEVVTKLLSLAVIVVRRDNIHDKLDLLDRVLWRRDLAFHFLGFFAQLRPLVVVLHEPSFGLALLRLGSPALEVVTGPGVVATASVLAFAATSIVVTLLL